MNRDMLLLAERLVIAMETVSQDVKNMSAYVYDLSRSVSFLLNERKEKECISVISNDRDDNPSNVTSAAGLEVSAGRLYSGRYERADEGSSSQIADPEHVEISSGDIASMSIFPNEKPDVQSLENNPISTDGIKIEVQTEDNINEEMCDIPNMYGHSRTVDTEYVTPMNRIPEQGGRNHQTECGEDAFVVHTRVDLEEKTHKCSVCEKSFTVHSRLKRHMRVHSGEKPYKCNICGKTCSQSSNLTVHMRYHTGEKPYKCTLCGKSFTQSSTLTLHVRSHTGVKPFKCVLCGKAFSDNRRLKEHVLIHTGEKPYRCIVCGKAFRYRSAFTHHMHTHSAEQLLQ